MFKFWLREPLHEAAAGDGGAGGGGAQFDPAAFKTDLLKEVSKLIGDNSKSLLGEVSKLVKPPAADPNDPKAGADPNDPKAGADPNKAKGDPALERKLKALEDQLAQEKKAREETSKQAAEKERLAAIRDSISSHQFATDGLKDDAFRYFRDAVVRGEDGELYGPDNMPLKEFVGDVMKKRTDWAPMRDVGGAGGRGGNRQGSGNAKPLQMEDIKPGMKPEEYRAIGAQLADIIKSGQ